MFLSVEDLLKTQDQIHVYGYGSLTWKPDFEYDDLFLGHIKGYERRFWQGSTHHRGTVEKPGRVLTLRKVEDGKCWGVVFEISGSDKIQKAVNHLKLREQVIGHYDVFLLPVYPHQSSGRKDVVYSIVYYATSINPMYLGPDRSLNEIAEDIFTSRGKVGHNIEYLFRLADFMRTSLPEEKDDHLFELDQLVRVKCGLGKKNTLQWKSLLTINKFRNIIYSFEKFGNTLTVPQSLSLLAPPVSPLSPLSPRLNSPTTLCF